MCVVRQRRHIARPLLHSAVESSHGAVCVFSCVFSILAFFPLHLPSQLSLVDQFPWHHPFLSPTDPSRCAIELFLHLVCPVPQYCSCGYIVEHGQRATSSHIDMKRYKWGSGWPCSCNLGDVRASIQGLRGRKPVRP